MQHDLSVRIADFNSDGADDVLVLHPGTPTGSNDYQRGFQLYTWRNGGFVRIGLNRAAFPAGVVASEAVQPLDVNGDGLTDIAQVWSGNPSFLRLLRRVGEVPDRMIGVDIEGIGPRVSVDYTTLSAPEHAPGTCTYPLTCPTRGGSIVSTHRLPNGEDSGLIWRTFEHDYRAARVDLLGRGWLGFEEHIVDDEEGNADTTTRFDNTTTRLVNTGDGQATVYPFAGTPVSVTRVVIDPLHWRYERQISNTYVYALGAVQGTYEVKLRSTLDEGLERHFPNVSFDLHSRSRTFEYGDLGNVSKVTTEDFGSSRVEESTYVNDTVNWLIGLPDTHTETDCTRPGDECVTRSKSFHHAANGNLDEIVVEPDDDDLRLITSIEYGANGNVTAVTMTDAEGLLASREHHL